MALEFIRPPQPTAAISIILKPAGAMRDDPKPMPQGNYNWIAKPVVAMCDDLRPKPMNWLIDAPSLPMVLRSATNCQGKIKPMDSSTLPLVSPLRACEANELAD